MGGVQLWETLKESIVTYTGLPPTTFFTLLALLFAFYYVLSDLFGSSSSNHPPVQVEKEDLPPLKPPVQLGEITEEHLRLYDGSNPEKPLLMAIKGHIYDVSQSRMFYGPGGPYALFAGKDASRALAKMSFEEKDLTGDISGLGPFELEALQDWEYRFMEKYAKVGTIKSIVPVTNAESTVEHDGQSETASDVDDVKSTEDGQSETAAVKHDVDDVKPTENGQTETAAVKNNVDDVKPTENSQSETAAVKNDVDDVKPTENSQSETAAVKHDIDDVKPTENGQSETAAVKHDVDDVKPTENSQSETAAVKHDIDDVKPTENGQSETAAVKHDVDDVKPTENGQSETVAVKHDVNGQSEAAAVKHDETPSNVGHHQTRHFEEEELKLYDGSDPEKPLLMAIKGQIYDVSQSRMIYGPDGPYALFAGKDASRALAKMSFEEKDLTGDISGLGPSELEALQNWEDKFMEKYSKVGTIKV